VSYREIPFFFEAEGSALLGIATVPDSSTQLPVRLGVVIVVGGPQYRVGSHRQFVLLARALATAGIACMRFDYRGMGDSEGPVTGFAAVDTDVRAAIDAFVDKVPSVEHVILWGLCDGASASAFYAANDDHRVAGLVLYNPWVRTESGEAIAVLKHYYARRLLDGGFWRKLAGGGVQWRESVTGLWRRIVQTASVAKAPEVGGADTSQDLPNRFADSVARYPRPVLIVLSGNDTVAAEFKGHSTRVPALAAVVARENVSTVDFPGVDHTFSCAEWRDMGAAATIAWLRSQFAASLAPAHGNALISPEVK
jgi:uncharacterized protein